MFSNGFKCFGCSLFWVDSNSNRLLGVKRVTESKHVCPTDSSTGVLVSSAYPSQVLWREQDSSQEKRALSEDEPWDLEIRNVDMGHEGDWQRRAFLGTVKLIVPPGPVCSSTPTRHGLFSCSDQSPPVTRQRSGRSNTRKIKTNTFLTLGRFHNHVTKGLPI